MKALRFDSRNIATRQSAILKLDLSASLGATDLGLEFWGKRTGSTQGKFELAISGDGASWSTIHRETPDLEYRRFSVDLDQALFDAGIVLDADVFIRFGHLALVQDLFLDDIRIVRGVDVVGPTVVGHTPTSVGSTGGPLSQISVTFNESMDPSTISAGDVSLTDPQGNAVLVTSVTPSIITGGGGAPPADAQFDIRFADQNLRGVYRIAIGPAVTDAAGNALNQDGDLLSGESNDGYQGTVTFEPDALTLPVGDPLLTESFEGQLSESAHWSFGAISGGTIEASAINPRSGAMALQFNSMDIAQPQWAGMKLDMAALAAETGLALEFWSRQTGSVHGRLCVEFSGDGATWLEAMRVTPAAQYGRFGIDLDATLATAGIALDTDVYIRFRHLGLIQDIFIDDIRILRGVDVLGPRVASIGPLMVDSGAGPLNQITVSFDEAMDPASVTPADLFLKDPWGSTVAIDGVNEVPLSGAMSFVATFADQRMRGVYSLTVGPNVADAAGNLMNQDGDGMGGEAGDFFQGSIEFASTAQALTGGPGMELLVETFEAWPPPDDYWSFGTVSGGMIGTSTNAPHGGSKELQLNPMDSANPQWAILKLDLSALSAATDLSAEFWARQAGSTRGRVCLDLSGDGATWTEAMLVDPAAQYQRFALDLDAALAVAGITPDADVYVRFRHLGLTQDLFLDDLRIVRGQDLIGPRVAAQTPTLVAGGAGPLNQITVTFDEAVDSATISVDDVRVWDPYGAAVEVTGFSEAGGAPSLSYIIAFADQTARGVYRLAVGPNLADTAGNLMNQDGDIHVGETEDAYRGTVHFDGTAIVVNDGMGALFSEGFETWPPSGNQWSFSANSGGMISVSTTMPNAGLQHLLFDSMNTAEAQYAVLKVDLTAVAAAPDLAVDFWAKRMGSTVGRFCADVSGDGITWKEVFCARSASSFQNYSFDLDKALRDSGQTADSDVYIRFRHFGLIQDFLLDDVRILRVGLMPATITSVKAVEGGTEVSVSGDFGVIYRIESSSDLLMWSSVGMVTGADGVVTLLDATVNQGGQRFYRAVLHQIP